MAIRSCHLLSLPADLGECFGQRPFGLVFTDSLHNRCGFHGENRKKVTSGEFSTLFTFSKVQETYNRLSCSWEEVIGREVNSVQGS